MVTFAPGAVPPQYSRLEFLEQLDLQALLHSLKIIKCHISLAELLNVWR